MNQTDIFLSCANQKGKKCQTFARTAVNERDKQFIPADYAVFCHVIQIISDSEFYLFPIGLLHRFKVA